MYNFDEIIDRKNTSSLKYDFAAERGYPHDVLPLWVADMDFRVPKEVEEALVQKSQHGIFGYSEPGQSYYDALQSWFYGRHGLCIEKDWLLLTPGVVFAINLAIRSLTEKGDGVLIQKPVYYPFFHSIEKNGRVVVNNSLVNINGKYEVDFADFEEKIVEGNVKLFILCSPHNPVGRVWTEEELRKMGDICLKHNVIIISDEIHGDFVSEGHRHIPFISLSEELKNNTILCTAPSKTFNLAALQLSNIFVPNAQIRRKLQKEMDCTGYFPSPIMGLVSCEAAYRYGAVWLEELKEYLAGSVQLVRDYLREHLPKVKLVEPEGTYLLWLDFRKLGLSGRELDDIMVREARLWLDGGTMFGAEGDGYQRINIATSRKNIEEALLRIKGAFEKYL